MVLEHNLMPDLNFDWTPPNIVRRRKKEYLEMVGNEGNESPPDNEVEEFEESKECCSIEAAMNSHHFQSKTCSKYFKFKVGKRALSLEKPPSKQASLEMKPIDKNVSNHVPR